jgi:hypothetical protein
MNAYVMEQIARYRGRELRSSAAQRCLIAALRRRRDRPIQHCVGWALVSIGSALACGASDA